MSAGQSADPEGPPGRFISQGYQGAVFVVGDGAERVVVKQPMGGRIACRIRRAMLRREYAAYRRLTGIDGVPRCFGLREDGSLLLEFVEGEPFRESAHALQDRETFFSELLRIILAVHEAGVSHADLKRRGNILISPEGRPYLIDFGSAMMSREDGGIVNRALFRQTCRMDLNAWIKLKYRRRYDRISPADAVYYHPTAVEAVARVIRRVWRRLTGRRFRKAWRQRRHR